MCSLLFIQQRMRGGMHRTSPFEPSKSVSICDMPWENEVHSQIIHSYDVLDLMRIFESSLLLIERFFLNCL
jgi:hypothetical protein